MIWDIKEKHWYLELKLFTQELWLQLIVSILTLYSILTLTLPHIYERHMKYV